MKSKIVFSILGSFILATMLFGNRQALAGGEIESRLFGKNSGLDELVHTGGRGIDTIANGYRIYLPLILKNYPMLAVYVSVNTGDDINPGTKDSPVASIMTCLLRARQAGAPIVYVQAGHYDEVVEVEEGIDIQGGYDSNWEFGDYRDPAHRVIIKGGYHSGDHQYQTLRSRDLTKVTTLSDLIIVGPDVSGPSSGIRSTYAVHVANSNKLVLERVRIEAGYAADGVSGVNGTNASESPAQSGSPGGSAGTFYSTCDDTTKGTGGIAGGSGSFRGGNGGNGGTMDTDCALGICISGNCEARPGQAGFNAAVTYSGSGHGGAGGAGQAICGAGIGGEDGRTLDGVGGSGGSPIGSLVALYWQSADSATNGSLGEDGTGGGGGGGSGGCDVGTDSYGAGGGGGGAGGGRAPSAGGAGLDGGSSFCVFALNSQLEILDSEIKLGVGGRGGNGGDGGKGQPGGSGGSGGAPSDDSKAGGNGGNGGYGGASGGSGGGAGGSVLGVYYNSPVTLIGVTYFGGIYGLGGYGGYGGVNNNGGEDGDIGVKYNSYYAP